MFIQDGIEPRTLLFGYGGALVELKTWTGHISFFSLNVLYNIGTVPSLFPEMNCKNCKICT